MLKVISNLRMVAGLGLKIDYNNTVVNVRMGKQRPSFHMSCKLRILPEPRETKSSSGHSGLYFFSFN